MNAPEPKAATPPADAMLVARAPLVHFAPSLTNRKHSETYIRDELAPSLEPDGVLQPITARPWPASRGPAPKGVLYEIIIGEGRWLASGIKKLPDIPFFWRDVDDRTALRMQLVENLKRKDLTTIEEARGYQLLMKDHGLTAEQVAAEIGVKGKSRSYVYARLKLLDLGPGAVRFFEQGKLDASTALLVARIPDPKLQEKAAKDVATGQWGNSEPMSYRQAFDHIQRSYMLKLDEAPFSRTDPDLVKSAGACRDCPKRTGNAPDLFVDVKSPDMCTDPDCHEAKRAAHIKRQQELAKAEGRKIIKGEEARKIKPNSWDGIKGGYVDLDRQVRVGGKAKTLRQALGDDALKADLLVDPHKQGNLIEVVPVATIKDQLIAKGLADQLLPTRRVKSDAEKKAAHEHKISSIFGRRLFDQVRSRLITDMDETERAPYLEPEEERMVAHRFFDLTPYEQQKAIASLWLGPKEGDKPANEYDLVCELEERIDAMERKDLARLMMDLTLIAEAGPNSDHEQMLALAKSMNIDAEALKVEIRKELAPKEKPAAKKAPPAKAKASPKTATPAGSAAVSTPTKAAQASGKGATKPATPAKAKKPTAKKPEAKTSRAPATPANEPAAPVETIAPSRSVQARPFPTGNRPATAPIDELEAAGQTRLVP